jgi:hypothetical protein
LLPTLGTNAAGLLASCSPNLTLGFVETEVLAGGDENQLPVLGCVPAEGGTDVACCKGVTLCMECWVGLPLPDPAPCSGYLQPYICLFLTCRPCGFCLGLTIGRHHWDSRCLSSGLSTVRLQVAVMFLTQNLYNGQRPSPKTTSSGFWYLLNSAPRLSGLWW